MSNQLVAEAATFTKHNNQKRRKPLPSIGIEPAIPATERVQTHALDCTATTIEICLRCLQLNKAQRQHYKRRNWFHAKVTKITVRYLRLPRGIEEYVILEFDAAQSGRRAPNFGKDFVLPDYLQWHTATGHSWNNKMYIACKSSHIRNVPLSIAFVYTRQTYDGAN
jgi:hypothetical protein